MFAFHYHCDRLLEVAEGRQRVCICAGAKQVYYYYFFLVSFVVFFSLNRECKSLESSFSVTHYNECTFYISISHRLHHRVYVSSASLPLLFKYQVKAFAVSFSKDLCTVYKYI